MTNLSVQVDVVLARADASVEALASDISDDERRRADGYRVSEARETFVLSRVLLRRELATRLGCLPREIAFDVRPSGKPDVRCASEGGPDWRFSLSHTGPHVALAFALGADVGIDIERRDRAVDPLQIARRYFTPQEHAALAAAPDGDRLRWFYAGWTRKEAIVKARGATMADSLTTLSVDLDPDHHEPAYEDSESVGVRASCRVVSLEPAGTDLILALAVLDNRTPRPSLDIRSGTGIV